MMSFGWLSPSRSHFELLKTSKSSVSKLGMVTVGHWKNGKMDHEWLYWDNQDFMKQIGLAQ
jgi:hypothetical protein